MFAPGVAYIFGPNLESFEAGVVTVSLEVGAQAKLNADTAKMNANLLQMAMEMVQKAQSKGGD